MGPLFASTATQAVFGLGFIAVMAIVVLVPWTRLFSRPDASVTAPETLPEPGPVPEPEPVPSQPDPIPIEPEPGPVPEPVPAGAGLVISEPSNGIQSPATRAGLDDESVGLIEDDKRLEVEEVVTELDGDVDIRTAALHVDRESDVIRMDIAGPKPDGAFDTVPHHHH